MLKSIFVRASALAAALVVVSGAHAAGVMFDPTGAGGAGGASTVYKIDRLDWVPDNALAIGALSTLPKAFGGPTAAGQLGSENYFRTVAQGRLSSFGGLDSTNTDDDYSTLGLAFGKDFTFQTSFFEFGSSIGSATSTFRLAPGASFTLQFCVKVNDT